jgi:NAD(P)-dependent dehydrogenase (short-subunit alcohol dehydrogenase family)
VAATSTQPDRRVALVTGGGSGIGAASCARLLADGFDLAVLDLDDEAAVRAAGTDGIGLGVDVTEVDAVDRAVSSVLDRFGRIDVLVNNAGTTGGPMATRCHETPVDAWDRVVEVNLRGPFLMARAVLPTMLEQGRGHVITIASIAGMVAPRGRCAYTASKGGALMLTKSIAADYAADGIRANAVCPGWVHTPMTAWRLDDPELGARATSAIPLGRVAQADDIADVVSVLASERLGYVTGSAFVVDGGMTATMLM